MPADQDASRPLATFDPPLADAVVAVLRREGVAARTGGADAGEAEVLVPPSRRDEALSLLAAHMEELHELAANSRPAPDTAGGAPTLEDDEEEAGPPIVMERLRRSGLGIAAVLVPLLVITLAAPDLPISYAMIVFVGGLVAITAWRRRQDRD